MRSWGGNDGHDRCGDRGFDFASNEAMIALDRGHDRAAIGPRSDHEMISFSSRQTKIELSGRSQLHDEAAPRL